MQGALPIRGARSFHDQLCDRAVRWLIRMGCTCAVKEITTTATSEICDAIGFIGGVAVVVEVKTSRADFLRDCKKHHRFTDKGMGSYRYFMTPPKLIDPSELPAGWGLVEVTGKVCRIMAGEKRLNPWYGPLPFPEPNKRAEVGLLASLVRRLRDAEPSAQRIATKKLVAAEAEGQLGSDEFSEAEAA